MQVKMFNKITILFVFILFAAAAAAETIPAAPGSLALKAGWNLISSPTEEPILSTVIASYCTITAGPYYYDTSISPKAYKKSDRIQAFTGYWIRVEKACSVSVGDTDILEMKSLTLTKGWNIISGIGDFSDWEGCTVLGGPWAYSNSLNAYNKETVLTPSKGYWVRVADTCTLKKKAVQEVITVPLPDLIVTDLTLVPEPPIAVNYPFSFKVTIKNQGAARVWGENIAIRVSINNQEVQTFNGKGQWLEAGGTMTFDFTDPVTGARITRTATGVYTITAEVDVYKGVLESNETNNKLSKQFLVS